MSGRPEAPVAVALPSERRPYRQLLATMAPRRCSHRTCASSSRRPSRSGSAVRRTSCAPSVS